MIVVKLSGQELSTHSNKSEKCGNERRSLMV